MQIEFLLVICPNLFVDSSDFKTKRGDVVKEEKKSLRELFRKVPPKKWMLLAALGVVCLLMATYIEEMDSKKEVGESEKENTQMVAEDSYGEKLENRLEEILSTVEGAGRVEVIITFVDSGEKIVNKDVNNSSSSVTEQDSSGGSRVSQDTKHEEDTVLSGNSTGSGTPYVVQEMTPTVSGVLVVCDGGNSPVIVEKITNANSALFGLSVHKITVLKRETKQK